jgi:hypothetical protein
MGEAVPLEEAWWGKSVSATAATLVTARPAAKPAMAGNLMVE